MTIVILQLIIATLKLGFGACALGVARAPGAHPGLQRDTWLLTGVAFLLSGINNLAHNTAAAWAFAAGPATPLWDQFLRWSPVGNHSRSWLAIGYGGALIVLLLRKQNRNRRFWAGAFAGLVLGMILGGVFGWVEGSFSYARHLSAVALYDLFELSLLLTALIAALVTNGMDRLLWLCVVTYAFRMALNVLWLSARAWTDFEGIWTPSAVHIQMIAAFFWLLMIGLAVYRLTLARRGVQVPALLQHLQAKRPLAIR